MWNLGDFLAQKKCPGVRAEQAFHMSDGRPQGDITNEEVGVRQSKSESNVQTVYLESAGWVCGWMRERSLWGCMRVCSSACADGLCKSKGI